MSASLAPPAGAASGTCDVGGRPPGERNANQRNTGTPSKRKPGQRRGAMLREAHRTRLSGLLLRTPPLTQREVASLLGVDVATVNRDVRWLRREWAKERLRNGDELVGRELAHLEHQREAAYAGWDRSLEDRGRVRKVERRRRLEAVAGLTALGDFDAAAAAGPGGRGVVLVRTTAERMTESSSGDPRYLMAALKATNMIVDLLGLAEVTRARAADPEVADPTGPGTGGREWLTEVHAAVKRAGLMDLVLSEEAATGEDEGTEQ